MRGNKRTFQKMFLFENIEFGNISNFMPLNDPHDFLNEREWEVKKNFILNLSFKFCFYLKVAFEFYSEKTFLTKNT